jgi:RNA polymerase sigma-70 factor (ECF subfamily)
MIMRQVPHLTLEEEKRYVELAQAGDTKAVHTLIEAHYQQMYHLALKVTRDSDASEDVTQEACVQIMRRINQFRSESRFSSWVSRIVVNTALLRHRKEKRMIPSEDLISKTEADNAPNPEEHLVNHQLLEMTDSVLRQLRQGDRELFIRRFIDGQSLQNISHETGLSLPALKSRFHRARLRLKHVARTEAWGVDLQDELSALGA